MPWSAFQWNETVQQEGATRAGGLSPDSVDTSPMGIESPVEVFMKRKRRKFSTEFKSESVRLVQERAAHGLSSPASVQRESGPAR